MKSTFQGLRALNRDQVGLSIKIQNKPLKKVKNLISISWTKKNVLRGPFAIFEILNGPDLYIFLRPILKDRWSIGTLQEYLTGL